jgi:hypothetical protein
VADGRIVVQRDASIIKLLGETDWPAADLSTGERLHPDIILCATGFHQRVPFFDAEVQAKLLDASGDLRLYRQILPSGVPDLTFAGYNSSTISSLNAEVVALWIAALLSGHNRCSARRHTQRMVSRRLRWMTERTGGHHAHGTSIAPFTIHRVDELLGDLGAYRGLMHYIGD